MKDVESASASSAQVIKFEEDDPGYPPNWSTWKKTYIVVLGIVLILNSTLASSLSSGASAEIQEHFNVGSEEQLVLPTSVFLIGYVLGPLVFAPLSESNGRQFVVIPTFLVFTIFLMATALAPNWAAFNVFRLLSGFFGSTPLSLSGSLYSDIFSHPFKRGVSMAFFMTIASFGPAAGPIPGGYLATISWQWPFWFMLMFAGVSCIPVLLLPETYAPTILHRRAKKIRQKDPSSNIWAPIDFQKRTTREIIRVFFGRPFRMLFTEPIVAFSCLFLSLVYSVLFMLFQGYSIIFGPTYKFSPAEVSLCFLPVCIGCLIAFPFSLWWDITVRRAKQRGIPWAQRNEYQRLPLACIGGPFFTVGLFWIGWAARPSVHWIAPVLGGLPLGIGFVFLFISLINFMIDSYHIYAASALGASSVARSTFGIALPFATKPMYDSLGIAWACSLLGFISLAMCFIPFAFIKFGPLLRAKSKMCQELAKMQKA